MTETFSRIFQSDAWKRQPRVRQFEKLLDSPDLESLARRAHDTTLRFFGRTMRLFAPLYVSNECVNNCEYCGFSRDNPILRTTLTMDEVRREARHLLDKGFRNILLVAGEHPRFVSEGYLESCLETLRDECPGLSIEVGPMESPEYRRMVAAGCEGLVVYQETYDRDAYAAYHTAGPKKNFDWRLDCPQRGAEAGFRRLGIGALFGLSSWREEALALAAHADYLRRVCWKSSLTVSFPRLRPAAGGFQPRHPFSNADLTRLICCFRLCFPDVGIVLSTREPAALRDALVPLGITQMSAGSHTEPGGYTRAGVDDLHLTVRGRRQETTCSKTDSLATGQFEISDDRSPSEIAAMLAARGYEPVWKDWEGEILRVTETAPQDSNTSGRPAVR